MDLIRGSLEEDYWTTFSEFIVIGEIVSGEVVSDKLYNISYKVVPAVTLKGIEKSEISFFADKNQKLLVGVEYILFIDDKGRQSSCTPDMEFKSEWVKDGKQMPDLVPNKVASKIKQYLAKKP